MKQTIKYGKARLARFGATIVPTHAVTFNHPKSAFATRAGIVRVR